MTPVEPPGGWRDRAACRGMDPDVFHPTTRAGAAAAIAVCRTCPSQTACRKAGLEGSEGGVWGGELMGFVSGFHADPMPPKVVPCKVCGSKFHRPTPSTHLCSEACRKMATRAARVRYMRAVRGNQ